MATLNVLFSFLSFSFLSGCFRSVRSIWCTNANRSFRLGFGCCDSGDDWGLDLLRLFILFLALHHSIESCRLVCRIIQHDQFKSTHRPNPNTLMKHNSNISLRFVCSDGCHSFSQRESKKNKQTFLRSTTRVEGNDTEHCGRRELIRIDSSIHQMSST